MEAAEQPPKKRKLYDQEFASPAPLPPTPGDQEFASPAPLPPPTPTQPQPQPPSQEEILQKRRNREEIRTLVECYRRIRFCSSKKDGRLMPELEQAYLSLITASRGCTSLQRIVAELIPRYASFCPTALEAAAKVSINMYNWNLAIIMRGDDMDGVSYQITKTCILGLVDICRTASYEAPTSSVIQGICDAVFKIVLNFFVSTFEGKDIYHIGSRKIVELEEPMNFLDALKQGSEDENEPALLKLFELRALCLLCIFFSFPKNLLAACFELFTSAATDGHLNKGHYFLKQVTSHLNADEVNYVLEKTVDEHPVCTDTAVINTECEGQNLVEPRTTMESVSIKSNNCFMGMAVNRDSSLRSWIFSKYKKVSESLGTSVTFELSSILDKVFGSLSHIKEADLEESDGISADLSKGNMDPFLVRRAHLQHDGGVNASGDVFYAIDDTCRSDAHSKNNDSAEKYLAPVIKPRQVLSPNGASIHGGDELVFTRKMDTRDSEDASLKKKFGQNESTSENFLLGTKKEIDCLSDGSAGGSYGTAKSLSLNSGKTILARTSPDDKARTFLSPREHSAVHSHTSQSLWFFDGDSKAMDVISASKQLWLSYLGHDASEISVRLRFEDFGPLEQFLFLPAKDFALVEYRNILDAVKAREYMQGSSIWGGCLSVKFLDRGLGSRGYVNGVAIAESCHVYIGKVSTQQLKDEILHELLQVGLREPRAITELTSENAFLLEYSTAEEAAMAIGHIRYHRGNSGRHAYPRNNRGVFAFEEQLTPRKTSAAGYSPSHREPSHAGLDNKPGHRYSVSFGSRLDRSVHVPVSPKINVESYANQGHYGQAFNSNLNATRSVDILNVGSRKINDGSSIVPMDLPIPEGNVTPQSGERIMHSMKQENESHTLLKGVLPQRPVVAPACSIIPPPVPMPYIRPVYFTPSSSWDGSGLNPPLNRPSCIKPNDSRSIRSCPPVPFIPCSITPLSQLSGGAIAGLPNVAPPPPTVSDSPLPLRSSPPPLPLSQPPPIPPPPDSPPPQPSADSLSLQKAAASMQHQWQGNLSKSGVHYCTVYASREESVACKYLNAASEPTDWPARLDVTKRTDFQHVKTTFINTPSHKREVCRLLPLTTSDHKGIHDFTSYLKQRECAGVIKIPAGKSMWSRLLFILPDSVDTCSLLAIAHHPAVCLIALVLPKETSLE